MSESTYKRWEVWVEGYSTSGEGSRAEMIGTDKGLTFREAAELCLARNGYDLDDPRVYNRERMAVWGCRLFDNETDARRAFG